MQWVPSAGKDEAKFGFSLKKSVNSLRTMVITEVGKSKRGVLGLTQSEIPRKKKKKPEKTCNTLPKIGEIPKLLDSLRRRANARNES